jgi:hypothetical protein
MFYNISIVFRNKKHFKFKEIILKRNSRTKIILNNVNIKTNKEE